MRSTVGNYRTENIVTRGLVLYLDAGNPNSYYGPSNSLVWKDLSKNANNGTLVNGPTFNDGAFVFDGVDDIVVIDDIPFRFSEPNFTICAVFYWDNISKISSIFSKRKGPPIYSQYSFTIASSYTGVSPGKKINFFVRSDTTSSNSVILSADLPNVETPIMIHGVVSENTQQLYINGNLDKSSSLSLTGLTYDIDGRNLTVGGANNNANDGFISLFNNKIYSVSIYNRALSSSEISQNFNAQRSRFGI